MSDIHPTPPPVLYKFLPTQRITYLNDELLRFTQPEDLNDIFDCFPVPDEGDLQKIKAEILDSTAKDMEQKINTISDSNERFRARSNLARAMKVREEQYNLYPEKLRKMWMQGFYKITNEHVLVFSLSERWDSILMWSHYAEKDLGFCLGFRTSHQFFQHHSDDKIDTGWLMKVDYRTSRPIVRLYDDQSVMDSFFIKQLDWCYEKEYRLIRNRSVANKEFEFKNKKVYLFQIPLDALSEIIITKNTRSDIREKIIQTGKKQRIPVFEIELDIKDYKISKFPF